MVVGQFDIESVAILESETDPPLIVNRYGILAFPFPAEFVESIASRDFEIFETRGEMDVLQSSHRASPNIGGKSPRSPGFEQLPRVPVGKRLNHIPMYCVT